VARLLVVDSSTEDRTAISRHLRDAGHEAVCAADALTAISMLQGSHFDAVITEWESAGVSALDLVDTVRRNPGGAAARILVTAAETDTHDMVVALDHGVDEYLVKTSRPEELVARVNAVLRRPPILTGTVLCVGKVTLDRTSHRVTAGGAEIELAPAEFRLMAYFMANPGRVLSRKQLLDQVWNRRRGVGERTVDVHVRRLRAALTPHGCDDLLRTVRGFGYRFG
jgi:two-component system phosphate regulon response regulator PhoB